MDETLYTVESAAFAGETLTVRRLHVVEELSRPYRVELQIVAPTPDADLTTMLGKDATLRMVRAGTEHPIAGLVVSVREISHGFDYLPEAKIVIAPALSLLALRRNTRMFQEKTAPEILEAVLGAALGPYSRQIRLELGGTYTPREYCLQYQESDLDFVHRVMEEEGIHYVFDQLGEAEVMVLGDANDVFPEAITAAGPLPYLPHDLGSGGETEAVMRFRVETRHATTKVTVTDFDWSQTTMRIEQVEEGEDARGRVRESYEHGASRSLRIGSYDEGAHLYTEHDAKRQGALRQEAYRRDEVIGFGVARAVGLAAGASFELTGHPSPDADGAYLITRIEHLDEEFASAGDGRDPYHARFECIPLTTPFRPRRVTAKPTVRGPQTAVVTGPAGEEIHVDYHGRIKVRFHWDRESPVDETSSCWVRVKQEWAGPGWGFTWIPRMGMEVLVSFIDGDPDRPLVTGATYDAERATPYALPDEKTKSTIKSNSSLGGGGDNELRFEDKAGSEQIFTHAQKDYDEVVENDHNTLVHHDQKNEVDGDQTQTIHDNQTERVDANQDMSVGGDRTVHVFGDYDETIDGTETRTVKGAVTETFDATETRTIAGSITETIGASETRDVASSQTETIGGAHTQTIGAAETTTIGGAFDLNVVGGITTITPGAVDATVAGGWNVTAPGGITVLGLGGIKIVAPGGVQRVDFEWDTKATGYEGVFAAANFETYAVKLEVNLTAELSAAILRFNDTMSENIIVGMASAVRAMHAKRKALKNQTGGIDVDAAQDIEAGGA